MAKKVRFGDLVRNCGRPQVITLWTKPERIPWLTAAIKQNRVLTVIQEPSKTDYGMIGFELRPGALHLIFPRALPRENAKVIGMNYQLVEEPAITDAPGAIEAKPSRKRKKAKAPQEDGQA